jgi:hypothetical protein
MSDDFNEHTFEIYPAIYSYFAGSSASNPGGDERSSTRESAGQLSYLPYLLKLG